MQTRNDMRAVGMHLAMDLLYSKVKKDTFLKANYFEIGDRPYITSPTQGEGDLPKGDVSP